MIDTLSQAIDECALRDRHSLRRQLQELRARASGGNPDSAGLERLQARIDRSKAGCAARLQYLPSSIDIPEILPIAAHESEIAELLARHQVIVVAGETGSGKTTQLPKICLKAGLGRYGRIGHTQPRRLAAISVANRIAEELGTKIGAGVGYQIRFNDETGDGTALKLMTDGILLNEMQRDRFLNDYEVLIIDEAHERSLNIDFILGYLKRLLPDRPELRVIVTSATIDVDRFSRHFDNAPVVSVSGRTYPVEIRYSPIENLRGATDIDDPQGAAVVEAVQQIVNMDGKRGSPGDVLVFFSSEKEIRETALKLRKCRLANTEVLPLYARLRQGEQIRIFQPHRGRRVILATNIAETSITVPGIRYVVDTGLARISRYSVQSKIQRLPIEPVSQASARQRAGRCGRVSEGICIRLYSEQDFESRPEFTDPEILRTNLAAVILQMLFLRLGNVGEFPFIDAPESKAINDGYKLLTELGAIDGSQRLTPIGRTIARLPVDPRLGRMLIAADSRGCLVETAIIVSALSIQDPREVPADKRQLARERQAVFAHEESDFLGLVKLWDDYEQRRQDLSSSALRKFCTRHFLSFVRMKEWRETHRQLLALARQQSLTLNQTPGTYRDLHTAILAGSLNQVGYRNEGSEYLGSRNRRFRLLPSSNLATKPPKWIVSGEIFETGQAYSSAAARIEPEWIEEVAAHLTRKSWSEPHWSVKHQRVMAHEKVTLYGLVIIDRRQVAYGEIDPGVCRDLFISEALVGQQLESTLPFYEKNRELLRDVERQEEKMRKQAFFLDRRRIEDFYASRLPDDVIDRASLIRWYRKESGKRRGLLELRLEDLMPKDSRASLQKAFPDRARLHNNPLEVGYEFDPGSQRDGATIEVPVPLLDQLSQKDLDWAIPGQVRERSVQLLKSLPKSTRKRLIPLPDFVDAALEGLDFSAQEVDLIAVLCEQARRLKGVEIRREMLDAGNLPEYLRVKIRVVDDRGKTLDSGSDLDALKQAVLSRPGMELPQAAPEPSHPLTRSGLTDWTLDELPTKLEVGRQLKLVRYPALVDNGDSVSVVLLSDPVRARAESRLGLVRLLRLRTGQQSRQILKLFLARQKSWGLKLPPWLNDKDCAEDFIIAVYFHCFDARDSIPGDKAAFEDRLNNGRAQLYAAAELLLGALDRAVEASCDIRRKLTQLGRPHQEKLTSDVGEQLEHLFSACFLRHIGFDWISQLPRYCQAIDYRLDKAAAQPDRDADLLAKLMPAWQRLLRLERGDRSLNAFVEDDADLQQYRWMVEEFRVSLFAQPLGTKLPVSSQRLDRLWQKISAQG